MPLMNAPTVATLESNLWSNDAALAKHADACYLALVARDARFDGLFFTGVTSTGIYCRPICRVRTPMRRNCVFFKLPAQAEQAGFRPCLRCRPELAPHSQPWSMLDAANVLLGQAMRMLQQPDSTWVNASASGPTASALATRLGVSDRHLRRLFQTKLGVSPLQYLQTQRLLAAKQLLTDTRLPMSEVAQASGFGSVRRFNDALKTHYALTPGAMRRTQSSTTSAAQPIQTLSYRPPFDVDALLAFIHARSCANVEQVDLPGRSITRTLRWAGPTPTQQTTNGWLKVVFDSSLPLVRLEVSEALSPYLLPITRQVRHWLDLDAEPLALATTLAHNFPGSAGVRLPGSIDGFELAVRAVLGQQITVKAASRLMAKLTQSLGSPMETPWPTLNRLPPTPTQLLQAPDDLLGQLGVIGQRQRALKALAHAVLREGLTLNPTANPQATESALLALPGFGPWTCSYVLMRALHWPDAFPAGDVALQKALGTRTQSKATQATEQMALAWQPWRSYAALCLWQGLKPGAEELI